MEPILEELHRTATTITHHPPRIPLITNLTGQAAEELTPEHWVAHLRQPVLFAPGLRHLEATYQPTTWLEIGPGNTLATAAAQTVDPPLATTALPHDTAETEGLATALARLHVAGTQVDWHAWFGKGPARPLALPTYPFQRQDYWLAGAPEAAADDAEFWAAVDSGDPEIFAQTLDATTDQRPLLDAVLPSLAAWRRQRRQQATVDEWRYVADWRPLPEPAGTPALDGAWLVLTPSPTGWAEAVAAEIETYGAAATVVSAGPDTDFAALLERSGPLAGIVSLLALDESPHPDHPAVPAGLVANTRLLQVDTTAPLWCLTEGAVGQSPHPAQAPIWGLGRTAALELPQRWGGLIDLPEAGTALGGRLARVLAPGQPEDQVAIRADGVHVRRLARRPATAAATPWRPEGTTLITGGTGALGAHVARWLAANGAPRLLLTNRTGPDTPQAAALARELAAMGAEVTITALDATDRNALANLLTTIPDTHPLTTVIHTAGTAETGPINTITTQQLQNTHAAKALGAQHLHELTQHTPTITTFILFSSNAATWGSGQQAAYAAANAHLDALAEHRHANGLPATSIAWGPWQETGMAADPRAQAYYARRGTLPLSPELGIRALHQALTEGDTTITIADIDWPTFGGVFTAQRPSPLLADLLDAGPDADGEGDGEGGTRALTALRQKLADTPAARRSHLLVRHVQELAANVLGHARPDDVPAGAAFQELGFDSLTAVELRNHLTTTTGLTLPPTLIYDHPTPHHLATHLHTQLTNTQPHTTTTTTHTHNPDEPIAIIAMACRYPGNTNNPTDLWNLLHHQTDAITTMPTNRGWNLTTLYHPNPNHPGTTYTQHGGFLHTAPQFDPTFFNISPREALAMDPQQRLLLETAWETFENAGLTRTTLHTSNTGVFCGITSQDYMSLAGQGDSEVEGYVATGNIGSVASGRVSYTFGLQGPAVTVDTACSSSLVAIHLASQSLRNGECDLALAGGATVMATPGAFIEFSRQRGLAADGRCKPFAAAADGTGWAEGAGLILLERLSDAQHNGHQILAVLRGSAINQDGASNGLAAPNGPAQQRVIMRALANAGLAPSDVDAVEAHGTGTTLGDPIEAQAIIATYGQDRPADRPLWLGSIKSNIGHTQAAAGVAGVIKMVQALQHNTLPATLHIQEPTPHVDWTTGTVRLLTEPVAWTPTDQPRRAGISAFGISGTNAHLIIEEPPPPATTPEPTDPPRTTTAPWLVSARNEPALRAQATQLLDVAEDADPADLAWSLATTRTHFEHRAAILNGPEALTALATGDPHPDLVRGTAVPIGPGPVLVFPGQGSQWAGMGVDLLDSSPAFAERIAACERALSPYVGWSLTGVLRDGEPITRVDVVQPVLWAVMVSLAELWRAYGVEPAAVVGHSQGEIAAACVAGVLSLEDGAKVVALRSQALRALSGTGAMASLAISEEDAAAWLTGHPDVHIAAVNGPNATVVSGPPEQVQTLVADCELAGHRARLIDVDYASHHPQVDAVADTLRRHLGELAHGEGTAAFYSTVTGDQLATGGLDAGYWLTNLRQPVRFLDTVDALVRDGHRIFIEASPHPVLVTSVQEALERSGTPGAVLATLRRDQGDTHQLTRAAAHAHVSGVPVDWAGWFTAGAQPRAIPLPTYPFQRQRYWVEPAAPAPGQGSRTSGLRYRTTWRPVAEPAAAPDLTGDWHVFTAGPHPATDTVLNAIESHGGTATVHRVDAGTDLHRLLDAAGPATGLISLLALDETPHPRYPAVPAGLAANIRLLQAERAAPLWCLTQGAVAVLPGDPTPAPAQAHTWGLGRTAALEQPRLWAGLVDLPAEGGATDHIRLAQLLAAERGEDQTAIRGGEAYARRLERAPVDRRPATWRPTGSTLITGGTGALGTHVARWLAANGAPHLVLANRTGPDTPHATALAEELTAAGATVTIAAWDPADPDALAALLADLPEDHPLTTVVHAAGVPENALLEQLDEPHLAGVLAPKSLAAAHLHALTRNIPTVTAFVLFSSGAASWGSSRQGSYSAANAYLDALAEHRRAAGLPATSVAWGPWAEGGMAADPAALDYFRRRGIAPLAPEVAIEALHEVISHGEITATVADIDWKVFPAVFTAQRPSPLISDLVPSPHPAGEQVEPEQAGAALRAQLATVPAAERHHVLLRHVQGYAASVLGHADPTSVPAHQPFQELGFDSLTGVELRNHLNASTGLRLPPTLVYDYPTPDELAGFLGGQLSGDPGGPALGPLPELDRWDSAREPSDVDEQTRREVTDRLRALLAKWGEPAGDGAHQDLAMASADDIFDLISTEFGKA
ncbi:hypothetical protein Phou_049770 [Phytohabitans houttuyneae]|uniref:Carrier domain-containing protein n=6 Tax=Phytohabitans houttuyneae TaxID=1076126 RepID=A0A6V8KGH4_9ACTN|nr:hypothetical protein Phou_049770 [Phytohabitans houttuyneae]